MARSELKIECNVNLSVSREQAERCLRILEMYLDDNPSIVVECERKKLFNEKETFIKNYLHLRRI